MGAASWIVAAAILGGLFVAPCAFAGPITPPPGPVASTPGPEARKAIDAVNTPGDANSVYRISQPGSYYLTANVLGQSGKNGIEIAASDVTVDLNGFALLGTPDSRSGVATPAGVRAITVRNGAASGWGIAGIDLYGGGSTNGCIVEGVISRANVGRGFHLGFNPILRNCVAESNGSVGINAGFNAVITNCIAYLNGSDGMSLGNAAVVSGCSVRNNTGRGIAAGAATRIVDCGVFSNGGDGISASASSTVSGCAVATNTGNGIVVAATCHVQSCSLQGNQVNGILLQGGDSFATDNECGDNGGSTSPNAGIAVLASDCRVEGNNVSDSPIGIRVTLSGNFVTRNTCSGNTVNWDIAANNKCLVVNGVDSPAFSGNAGGLSPGSTDPNANYSY